MNTSILVVALMAHVPIAAVATDTEIDRVTRPNIIIIFTDDQGWGDIGPQGAEGFATPNIDRMAQEGVRLTDFYVAQPVCSASRAALLTGCYPNRIGIAGALGPLAKHGIHEDELTLGELCQSRVYKTAAFGKWHLGHHPMFLPVNHGFDEYFGIPYSNDMWPRHPEHTQGYPPLPLIEGTEIIEEDPDQSRFTREFTLRAVEFIKANADSPFLVYLAHPMPHVPLFASSTFDGTSRQGAYGDVISEIDWSVGRLMETVRELGKSEDTLVIFTTDNGPWLSYGDHAGTTGPLREGKGTTFEGGVRVPFIAWWPGTIPAGMTCSEPAMTIDIMPTVAGLVDGELPEHQIDGKDILPLLTCREGARSPHEVLFFYYRDNELQALRSGRWKLHFPHRYRTMNGREPGTGGIPGKYDYSPRTELELYDLETDIGETVDVSAVHPEVMERLVRLADSMREDLGDSLTEKPGTLRRSPGRLKEPASTPE
ncbi:MAG: arylsulfatase [Phycisphaerae bacterium]|nr:arylsulfatase [Phycisphaerae bacterium]